MSGGRDVFGAMQLFARTLLLAYLASACMRYEVSTVPVAETLARRVPDDARIWVRNRGVVELRDVQVKGDSVVGFVRGSAMRYAVELSTVDAVEVKSLSVTRSVLLTAGIAAAAFIALLAVVVATLPPNPL